MSPMSKDKAMDYNKLLRANIDQRAWETLISAGNFKTYGPGEAIYVQNQPGIGLVCILKGKAKTSILFTDGTEKIFNILEAPAIIGETATFDGGLGICSATALTKVEIVAVPPDKAKEVLLKHPIVALSLLETVGKKLRCMALQAEDLSLHNISTRLARMILNFEQYGVFTRQDEEHCLQITHEELASFVGTTRPNVTSFLNDFARKGLIKIKRGKIIILDYNGLCRHADSELI